MRPRYLRNGLQGRRAGEMGQNSIDNQHAYSMAGVIASDRD